LQLTPSEKKLKASPVKNKKEYDTYLQALVDNKSDLELYNIISEKKKNTESTGLKSATITTGISVFCEYVVITPSSLASYFNDFIAWKKQKGVDIELVTTEQIFQNYTEMLFLASMIIQVKSGNFYLKHIRMDWNMHC
jgi:hypothetical protein